VDSSALAKLVLEEPESRALGCYLGSRHLIASELSMVEVARVETCTHSAEPSARRVPAEVDLMAVTRGLLDRAAELTSERVRSLDAIHLATALAVEPNEFVAYDRRLLAAAARVGLTIASPSVGLDGGGAGYRPTPILPRAPRARGCARRS
jgi:predicted nucleic acid-binding protein